MIYGSVCSGIEAATMAWHPLGWKPAFFSEIENFPSAVLAHHYPDVPNRGDMTKFQEWPSEPIELLVGGTPCQSFSVAGLRAGLADPRGNLALTYLAIAAKYQPRWVLWENVPGVFSSLSHDAPDPCPPPNPVDMELDGQEVGTVDEYDADETHAFGTFLAGLSELGYGLAYRTLDAQFCRAHGYEWAVPQRRRRVFVVGYLGDWRRAAAVLFDATSLRGDSPPRREAGQRVAPTISARTKGGGGLGADFDLDGGLIAGTLSANGKAAGSATQQDAENGLLVTQRGTAFGGNDTRGPIHASTALNAHGGPAGRLDFESETFVVAHALRGEGFDASEDGSGRGTPIVPVFAPAVSASLTRGAESAGKGGYAGRRQEDDSNLVAEPMVIMERGRDGTPVLEYRQDGTSNAILTPNGGRGGLGVGAIAHAIQAGATRENPSSGPDGVGVQADIAYTLEARPEVQAVQAAWAVRRLTPRECERLQGFPDDFTAIPNRGKPAADGPRYKALGNSMAVNVMRVIGVRIAMADALQADREVAA
jgi:DNA (cytosine-5)-methyltransferase 1